MRFFDRLNKVADLFKCKLVKTSKNKKKLKTSELFFDNERNMLNFSNIIKNPNGSIFKILNDFMKISGHSCSFDLKISAISNQNACWTLIVQPSSLKITVAKALNNEFKKIMKVSMSEQQRIADFGARGGSGDGAVNVGSITIEYKGY